MKIFKIYIFGVMLKSVAHSFFSLFFIIALLGPSVFITIQEEEAKEKIFSITDYVSHIHVYVPKKELNTAYVERRYIHTSEVFLPPPEHIS